MEPLTNTPGRPPGYFPSSEAIKAIKKAAGSRPVVPFLGAGISLAAGFPTIRFVVQYLAKMDFAIHLGVFADRFPDLAEQYEAVDRYRQHPSRFIEDFGWPDIGQLDADLWSWLGRNHKDNTFGPCGGQGRYEIALDPDCQAQTKTPQAVNRDPKQLAQLLCDIVPGRASGADSALDLRDHLNAIVQWSLRHDLMQRESGTAQATEKEWLLWKKWYHDGTPETGPSLLDGDWESMLDRLCEGSFDLTDRA